MSEKEREEMIDKLKEFFLKKAQEVGVDLVFLYGSWARGFPKADSDVDLAVNFKVEEEEEVFKAIAELSLSLMRDIKKEVSIIPIFSDFRKPMLYYNAVVLGEPIYIGERGKYIRFFVEAICQMEDFNIFGTKWQRYAAQKNLSEVRHGGIHLR